jgi:hypothetical protein
MQRWWMGCCLGVLLGVEVREHRASYLRTVPISAHARCAPASGLDRTRITSIRWCSLAVKGSVSVVVTQFRRPCKSRGLASH